MNQDNLIEVRDLAVEFVVGDALSAGGRKVSASISSAARPWRWSGESGSGKSVTAHSILRLLPYPLARHPSGTIEYSGQNLLNLKRNHPPYPRQPDRDDLPGADDLAQSAALDRKADQRGAGHPQGPERQNATKRTLELLEMVGIPEPHKRLKALPTNCPAANASG